MKEQVKTGSVTLQFDPKMKEEFPEDFWPDLARRLKIAALAKGFDLRDKYCANIVTAKLELVEKDRVTYSLRMEAQSGPVT